MSFEQNFSTSTFFSLSLPSLSFSAAGEKKTFLVFTCRFEDGGDDYETNVDFLESQIDECSNNEW